MSSKEAQTPMGVFLRYSPHNADIDFTSNENVDKVLVDIHIAKNLLDDGEDADSFFGCETTTITSTTISEELLTELSAEQELTIIQDFQPDFHIPFDTPIYQNHSQEYREKALKDYSQVVEWFFEEVENTILIPLIKGTNPKERKLWYENVSGLPVPCYTYYASPNFSKENPISKIQKEIKEIESWIDNSSLFLTGIGSKQVVDQLSKKVSGLSTQRWIHFDGQDTNEKVADWKRELDSILKSHQLRINGNYYSLTEANKGILNKEIKEVEHLMDNGNFMMALINRASFYENYLKSLLKSHMSEEAEKGLSNQHISVIDRMSLADCIRMGYMCGLVSKKEHDILNDLRGKRNQFCHQFWEDDGQQKVKNEIIRVLERTDDILYKWKNIQDSNHLPEINKSYISDLQTEVYALPKFIPNDGNK